MTNERRVLVHPDKEALAGSVAARFITKIIDVLEEQERGARLPHRRHDGLRRARGDRLVTARDSVDWSRIHFWWSDERYLPRGDADATRPSRARRCSTPDIPDAAQIHALPAPGEQPDIEAAARAYEAGARRRRRPTALRLPAFDVMFLGVGPDGHVASLFPDHAQVHETERVVVAETDSPKPPPERLSFTLPVINSSDRIWLVLAGADKAARPRTGPRRRQPRRGARGGREGRKRTVFFVDQEAAAEVPEALIAPSYYWTSQRTRSARTGRLSARLSCRRDLAAARAQLLERLARAAARPRRRCDAPSRRPGGSCTAPSWPAAAGCPCRGRRAAPSWGCR